MTVYSYSRIQKFRKCPLSYRFQYIDRVEVEYEESIEAFMGHKVHSALDVLYARVGCGKPAPFEDVLACYLDLWDSGFHDGLLINGAVGPDEYKNKGETCLKNYYESYKPFDQAEVLGTEMRIEADLFEDKTYRIMGYVDRLDKTADGRYEIHDYKTGKRLPSASRTDWEDQLALYQIAIQQNKPEAGEVDLVWHYLLHNKEIRREKSPGDLEKLREETVATIKEIEKAVEENNFPKITTPLCKWCVYQDHCAGKTCKKELQTTLSRFF